MLIDRFQPDWLSVLHRRYVDLPGGARLMVMVDGAFVPGLFRELHGECRPVPLFEALPGCSDETRDVSPFLVDFAPSDRVLARVLERCSGWPMVSAISTYETIELLGQRLAAWCVVEVGEHRFNFRFPDTRRLPAIFETLTGQQQAELIGNALGWSYIGRDGKWQDLPLEPLAHVAEPASKAALDDAQFGRLVTDSEPDEIWVRLLDLGLETLLLPSQRHALLTRALRTASEAPDDEALRLVWCHHCLAESDFDGAERRLADWAKWKNDYLRNEHEALHRIA